MHRPRRHLPHIYVICQPLFVTFRLYGSIPPGREFSPADLTSGRAFACFDRLLDSAREGPLYLTMPEIAEIVADALGHLDPHAWVIMPNHVHLLFAPHPVVAGVLQKLKGSTAYLANKQLGRTGPFWQR